MELPESLKNAIELELFKVSSKKLTGVVSELSDKYRTNKQSGGTSFIKSRQDVEAYVAFRMPATFAAVYSALKQVWKELPDWEPHTLLDVGAGPGTAIWAAIEVYTKLNTVTLLEREENMISLGKRLAINSEHISMRNANWIKMDITGEWAPAPHDLVISSYVLGELNEQNRDALVSKLWKATKGVLLIIEPGTPEGFSRIRKIRDQLITEDGIPVAPCPHDKGCPMAEDNWCHFSQRISRSRLHRQVKRGELSYEDEKFSFIAVSRMDRKNISARILRHPKIRKGFIEFEICGPDGVGKQIITRRDKELYRKAKDWGWGSAVPDMAVKKEKDKDYQDI